ncbi:MAG: GtrA family protein [Microbacteriaceae bacterium]
MRRAKLFARDFLKFGAVGLIGVVVDVGIFNILRFDPLGAGTELNEPLGAKIASVSIAVIVTWCGNRYWAFRHNRRADIVREFAEFAGVAVVGLGISLACLYVSHYVLGFQSILADNVATNVIGLTLSTAFRFFAYRHWVFSTSRTSRTSRYSEASIAATPSPSTHTSS